MKISKFCTKVWSKILWILLFLVYFQDLHENIAKYRLITEIETLIVSLIDQ